MGPLRLSKGCCGAGVLFYPLVMRESAMACRLSPSEEEIRAQRSRLYVAMQMGGWGALLSIFIFVGENAGPSDIRDRVIPQWTVTMCIGLLLTHFGRIWIHRRGWKNLNWKQLVPRVIAASLAGAAFWVSALVLWETKVAGWHFPPKISALLIMGISLVNCASILGTWMAVYFSYHLSDRFSRLKIEQLRLAESAKSSELRALKSQLNPHFIFNALNSMRALIDENPARARDAVTQLANLLRYSLQSAQLETVPFEDELRVVKDYLALEQVRHEQRLRYKFFISPDVVQCPIPPLLLQTLVENAVKYGISTRPDGGEIEISARIEHDVFCLRVTNPGRFFPRPGAANSIGVGLTNARERLRLLFGDRSQLEVKNAENDLVIAEALIPLITQLALI